MAADFATRRLCVGFELVIQPWQRTQLKRMLGALIRDFPGAPVVMYPWTLSTFEYPLELCYIAMENSTIFHGNTHYCISMAIFSGYFDTTRGYFVCWVPVVHHGHTMAEANKAGHPGCQTAGVPDESMQDHRASRWDVQNTAEVHGYKLRTRHNRTSSDKKSDYV